MLYKPIFYITLQYLMTVSVPQYTTLEPAMKLDDCRASA